MAKFDKATRYPRSRIEKLGVKAGSRVTTLGIDEPTFLEELKTAGADVSTRVRAQSDIILVQMTSTSDLLVDVKVMAFSETLSALKMVIPLAKR